MNNNLTGIAKQLRKRLTDAEGELWQRLRDRQLEGLKFRRQQPMGPSPLPSPIKGEGIMGTLTQNPMDQLKGLFRKSSKELTVYDEAFSFSRLVPDAKKVLVLCAHPDDETLGCGGAILLHKRAGAEVRSFVMTDGARVRYEGKEDIGELRRREALEAGKVLGIDKIQFLDISDMELEKNMDRASKEVFSVIDEYKPDLVYAPSPLDFHPDHRAVSRLAMSIAGKGIKIAFYEIYMPVRFNALIDITAVMPLKEKAFSLYVNSLLGKPEHFMKAFKGLNAYRSFMAEAVQEERFYEAFFVIDRPWGKDDLIKWLTYSL